ncbi:hypothetical protein [Mesorhizobium sp. WSM3882]|uniref:hypothetical protein n=1 Tax=Mesorhizobium sp. WSM3882 TaxID=2029407 RepID=UPI00117FE791|nr:hypothetical protein [Mesorhizobium sp. WSM3882]
MLAADLAAQREPARPTHRIRLGWMPVDLWLSIYVEPPNSVTLEIAHAFDVVHSHQQLSLFKPKRRAPLPADPHL